MTPKISVVISTYNRCESLGRMLESLLKQEGADEIAWEVIAVDNNSTDQTREVVESFHSRFRERLRYVFEPRQGLSHARNRGIRKSRGEIIAFTDDDVVLDRWWLKSILECFRDYDCDVVGGRVLPIYPQDTPAWVKENPQKAAGAVVIYDYGNQIQRYEALMDLFIGANFAFRQEVFAHCGMFRTDLKFGGLSINEDHEFIARLLKARKALYYSGKALVWHPVDLRRLGLRHMIRWHMTSGRAAARLESEEKGKISAFYFGVPRYLFREAVHNFLFLFLTPFNWLKFWKHFRSLFRALGMIAEYRSISKRLPNG